MKTLLLSVVALLLGLCLYGQESIMQKEVYLTYGTNFLDFNTEDNLSNHKYTGDSFATQWPINYNNPGPLLGPRYLKNYVASLGVLTLGFDLRQGKHQIGGLVSYESALVTKKTRVVTLFVGQPAPPPDQEEVNYVYVSDSRINNISLAARYDFAWLMRDKLKFYSGLSAGLVARRSNTVYYEMSHFQEYYPDEVLEDFLRDKKTQLWPHLHVNALGLRYGKQWALIAELGIGSRGYLNVGVSRVFDGSEAQEQRGL